MRNGLLVCTIFAVCLIGTARAAAPAQTDGAPVQRVLEPRQKFDFYARGPYRSEVPRPEALLGYQLGGRQTTYWEQDRVVRAIADAAKDRVRIIPYGQSVEGRPLRILAITSPENQARLDDIRAKIARLADPRGLSESDEAEIVRSTPVIVWINENIHGNESTSFESAMQLIYQLAASEEPRTLELLKNCIVIVNPSFNPDGHERFAIYNNSVSVGDPSNDALEHSEPWAIYGRFNHYRFDMNRDKLALSQQEVRQEIAEYLRWAPQVYADQHGEVSQYFFPPTALPVNANLDVARQEKWLDIFGRSNAAAFDRFGWDYFNRKTYDFFYVGYLDSWSALNGAIGMTYETDGGGRLGLAWNREDDTVITLRDGIAHHFVTALTTIETASINREAKLRDYVAYRRASVDDGRTGAMQRIVLVPGKDPERAAQLVTTLRRVGVEVGTATAGFASVEAHEYAAGPKAAATRRTFEAGAYVVDLAQPQGRLARAFLEPEAKLNPQFVRDELKKRARNDERGKDTPQEGAGFYDVTAWSLPFTYGVEAYWLGDAPNVALQPVGAPVDPAGARRSALAPEGRVVGGRGTSAFLFSYETNGAARLALALMQEGYHIAVTPYDLKAGGKLFPRGTIVVRTQRNPESLPERIAALARETGVEVTAVDSQYADEVTTGVGSEELQALRAPRILVAAGEPVSQTSFGAIWFMFERELQYPFTAMDTGEIAHTDLTKFNVIILPDGSPHEYADRVGKEGIERLRTWVRDGGTIVSFGGATAFLADKDLKLTTARIVGADEEDKDKDDHTKEAEPPKEKPKQELTPEQRAAAEKLGEPGKKAKPKTPEKSERTHKRTTKEPAGGQKPEGEEAETITRDKKDKGAVKVGKEGEEKPAGREPDEGAEGEDEEEAEEESAPDAEAVPKTPLSVPGAIFQARVDRNYFMSYGYESPTLAVPVNSDLFLRPSKDGANVVTFAQEPKRLSGFIWPKNTVQLLRGTAYVIEEPTGRGHLILFTEDIAFRRLWHALDRLFLNAVIFAPGY